MTTHSQQFLQKRRFYMVLPLLVLPFITMIFWALGGGKGGEVQAQEIKSGLNLELPGAHFNKGEELWDKFSLYEQAKRDSLKREEDKRNDPYYVVATLQGIADTIPDEVNGLNTSLGSKDKYGQITKDEKEINRKIELLTTQLNKEETKPSLATASSYREMSMDQIVRPSPPSEDVQRLEHMMQLMNEGDSGDPEMQQIDGMLEKILDIQHPERVREKIKAQSQQHTQEVFPVETAAIDDNITLVEGQVKSLPQHDIADSLEEMRSEPWVNTERNSFFGLEDDVASEEETSNAIEAVIHDTQTVVAGSTIKMRLLSDVFIHGQLIEKDQFVYGICAISGERLMIAINSIRDEHALFPVSLKVYDLDGLEGIYIPGAITRDAAKQASGQSIQDVQLYSMDNSLGVQAATAGIEAAKGLFSKKAKLIKVTVKAGYQILLRDSNQQNQ